MSLLSRKKNTFAEVSKNLSRYIWDLKIILLDHQYNYIASSMMSNAAKSFNILVTSFERPAFIINYFDNKIIFRYVSN